MKKIRKIAVVLCVVGLASLASSTAVFAASSPYKDVTVASVGKTGYDAISYLKKHHVYDGVFEGKKFKPNKAITLGEFTLMLINAYGYKTVPQTTEKELFRWNKKITESYAINKMVKVANNRGLTSIVWTGSNRKITRVYASKLLVLLTDFSKLLKPRR